MSSAADERSGSAGTEAPFELGATVGRRASLAEGLCSMAQVLRWLSGILALGAPCLVPLAVGSLLCLVATALAVLARNRTVRMDERPTVARAQRVAQAASIQAAVLGWGLVALVYGAWLLHALR